MRITNKGGDRVTITAEYERKMEARFEALREAEVLLDLIVMEWNSDPMSVQCFDERIVERAKQCVATLKANPRL